MTETETRWVAVGILAGAYVGSIDNARVHAEVREEVKIGRVKRAPGQLLCGYRTKRGSDDHCEDGSPLSAINCPRCCELIARAK